MSHKRNRSFALQPGEWRRNIGSREKYEAQIMRKPVEEVELADTTPYPFPQYTFPSPHTHPVKRNTKSRTKYCKKSGKLHTWGQWKQNQMRIGTRVQLLRSWDRFCVYCHKKETWYPPYKKESRYLEYEAVLPPGYPEQYRHFTCFKCKQAMERVGPYEYGCSCNPDARLLVA